MIDNKYNVGNVVFFEFCDYAALGKIQCIRIDDPEFIEYKIHFFTTDDTRIVLEKEIIGIANQEELPYDNLRALDTKLDSIKEWSKKKLNGCKILIEKKKNEVEKQIKAEMRIELREELERKNLIINKK